MSVKNKILKRSHRQKNSAGKCITCEENQEIVQNLKKQKLELSTTADEAGEVVEIVDVIK